MTNRVMIDIETLSTNDDAAVIAIGAAVFDNARVVEVRGWPLTFKGMTGHISPATIQWWMEQSKDAQEITFGGDRVAPWLAAQHLVEMLKKHDVKTVWANDPHFDVTILKNWWRRYREDAKIMAPIGVTLEPVILHPWPFEYDQPRSFRTIVELAKDYGFSNHMYDTAKGMYVKHSATDDAAAQARVVLACETWLSAIRSRSEQPTRTGGSWPAGDVARPDNWRTRHETDVNRDDPV